MTHESTGDGSVCRPAHRTVPCAPQENEIYELLIEDITKDGEGIGHIEGYTLFVKDAVPGDRIKAVITKAKKNYGYGHLQEIIEPSEDRVDAPCPVSKKCGGCQIMAMSYDSQLRFKKRIVENALRRIGGFDDIAVEDVLGMEYPFRYRNKTQYPVGERDGRMIAGYYASHSHNIMEHDDCITASTLSRCILDKVIELAGNYGIKPYDEKTGSGILRHVLIRESHSENEAVVCLIANAAHIPHEDEIASELMDIENVVGVCVNENRSRNNVILGDITRTVAGTPYITDRIGNVTYRISPVSFYQINSIQTKVLYDTVKEFADLSGNERIWDIYCGTGTISLYLADKAGEIIGVEVTPEAVDDARENARINGIENARFICGKAEEVIPEIVDKEKEKSASIPIDGGPAGGHRDVVIVDPPRKGCRKELLDAIIKLGPEKLIYVSCDPATLARDLKELAEYYRIERVQPADLFPMTVHVEAIVLMTRNK